MAFVPFVHKKDFINRSERAFWLVSNLLKVFFILTDQQKDKQELFIPNVSERHNKKIYVYFFKLITLEGEWMMKLVQFCLLKNFELFQKRWNSFAEVLLQVPSWAVYWCH